MTWNNTEKQCQEKRRVYVKDQILCLGNIPRIIKSIKFNLKHVASMKMLDFLRIKKKSNP